MASFDCAKSIEGVTGTLHQSTTVSAHDAALNGCPTSGANPCAGGHLAGNEQELESEESPAMDM